MGWFGKDPAPEAPGRFELRAYREPAVEPGVPFPGTQETLVGVYDTEAEAVAVGRELWREFRASGSKDVAWWVVRGEGEDLARWIADSASPRERVLDLRTRTLVEID